MTGVQTPKKTVFLFTYAFILTITISGFIYVFRGNSVTEIQIHDTYFVIAKMHLGLFMALFMGLMACLYYMFPKIFSKELNKTLGKIHFYITFIGMFVLFTIMYFMNITLPRRYYIFENSAYPVGTFEYFYNTHQLIALIFLLVILAQFLLVINMIYSLFKGPQGLKD